MYKPEEIRDRLIKTLKTHECSSILTPEQQTALVEFPGILESDYYTHSYEYFTEMLLNDMQFPSPQSKLIQITELIAKAYTSIFQLVDEISITNKHLEEKTEKNEEGISAMFKYLQECTMLPRSLGEMQALLRVRQDQLNAMKEAGVDIDNIDWPKMKLDVTYEKAEKMMDMMEKNPMGMSQMNISPQDRQLLEKVRKRREKTPKIQTVGSMQGLR
jgi:hypothetical protein